MKEKSDRYLFMLPIFQNRVKSALEWIIMTSLKYSPHGKRNQARPLKRLTPEMVNKQPNTLSLRMMMMMMMQLIVILIYI
jgi:hypothetical protein